MITDMDNTLYITARQTEYNLDNKDNCANF